MTCLQRLPKPGVFLTLVLLGACDAPRQQPQPQPQAVAAAPETLPQPEILTPSTDLKLSIRVVPETVGLGEEPAIVARFENVGSTDLYLNPHLIAGGFLAGRTEPVRCITNADYGMETLTAKDFIRLTPSGSWEHRIEPAGPASYNFRYRFTLGASPGTHQTSLRYENYPECRQFLYDPYQVGIRVWEGRIDAPGVPLTIRPLAEDAERTLIARVRGGKATDEDFTMLGAQNTPAANQALIEYLTRQPEYVWRFVRVIQERGDCQVWTAISGLVGSSGNHIEQPLLKDSLLAIGARCPAMLTDLRRRLADRSQPPDVRRHAAVVLGKFRQQEDVPVLIAAMRNRAYVPVNDREWSARAGAVQALADIGGDEAGTALIETLKDPGFAGIHHSITVFVSRLGTPAASAALVSQLDSSNADIVIRATLGLSQLKAKSATPDLIRLMRHRNPTIRLYAALALRQIADDSIQSEMRAALADPSLDVQVQALWYLAMHGDSSLAPLFEERAGSPNQSIRDMARKGLHRFGTTESVGKVRPLIESKAEVVRRSTTLALELLTFRTWQPPNGAEELRPGDFDAWWKANTQQSRQVWAMEALERPATTNVMMWWPPRFEKTRALEYLDAQRDPSLADIFRKQAHDPDWNVRIRAAEGLSRFDRPGAMRLLVREFDSRFLSACMMANDTLQRLTGETVTVDCESPESRREARARWAAVAQ